MARSSAFEVWTLGWPGPSRETRYMVKLKRVGLATWSAVQAMDSEKGIVGAMPLVGISEHFCRATLGLFVIIYVKAVSLGFVRRR